MYEIFKLAREAYEFPPQKELQDAINELLDTNVNDDVATLIATAFYAGTLYQQEFGDESIPIELTTEDSFKLMQQLVTNNEAKITFYIGETE